MLGLVFNQNLVCKKMYINDYISPPKNAIYLASQDAIEVMFVTEWVPFLTLNWLKVVKSGKKLKLSFDFSAIFWILIFIHTCNRFGPTDKKEVLRVRSFLSSWEFEKSSWDDIRFRIDPCENSLIICMARSKVSGVVLVWQGHDIFRNLNPTA